MDKLEAERVERADAGKTDTAHDRPVDPRVHHPFEGPAPEVQVSADLVRRGYCRAGPVAICGVFWGGDGAWSACTASPSCSPTSPSPLG